MDGEAHFTGLATSTAAGYEIKLKEVPAGYTAGSGKATLLLADVGVISASGTLPTEMEIDSNVLVITCETLTGSIVVKPDVNDVYPGAESLTASSYTYSVSINGGTATQYTVTDLTAGVEIANIPYGASYTVTPVKGSSDIWTASAVSGTFQPTAQGEKIDVSVSHFYKLDYENDSFTLTVVDKADSKGIKDVQFGIYSDAACTTLTGLYGTRTDENGKVTIPVTAAGTVYLKIYESPAAYDKGSQVVTVNVTSSYELRGDVITKVLTASATPETIQLEKIKLNLTVKLAWYGDRNKTRPESVKVYLYRDGVVCGSATVKASENWTYTWYGMTGGKYSVAEVTPTGYVWWVTADANTNTFTIHNNGGTPQTGDDNMPLFYAMLSLSSLAAAYYVFTKLRKENG